MKKKVIIISLSVLIIAFLALGIYLVLNKKEDTIKFDNVVTSSVILDINPSIKLELNKSSQVVNVIALIK